ncbi:cellulose synthase operon protein YhjQ [Pseudomonas syringae]|nr:cellulose synthase operon protein YhjQ [Pseudomonas syringae]
MHRADDIANLFQELDASTDAYVEIDTHFEYHEPPAPPLRSVPASVTPVIEALPASAMTAASIPPATETRVPPATSRKPLVEKTETSAAPGPKLQPAVPDAAVTAPAPEAEQVPERTPSVPLRSLLAEVAKARQGEAQKRNDEALQQALFKSPPPVIQARVIAVVSAKGGVGKSTVCAALARTVALPGGRTVAVELDPQNCLRHHFDASPDVAGLAPGSLRGEAWSDLLLTGAGNTRVLPYGTLAADERRTLEQYLDNDPDWLVRQIERMGLTAQDVLVLDVASGPSRYLDQALNVASHVLVVLDTEAAGYLTLEAMERALEPLAERAVPPACHYLINRVEAGRGFSADMHEVLCRRLGTRVIGRVRLDRHIAEALAFGTTVLQARMPTPGAQDLLDLGRSVTACLLGEQAQGVARS